jgi:hypothetical protein
MKGTAKFSLLAVTGLAIVGGFWIWKDRSRTLAVVPDGRAMRTHDATFGTVHTPKSLEPSLSKKVRDAIETRSLQPLRATGTGITSSGSNDLVLWVSEDDIPDLGGTISQISDLEIHLPDGQILMGRRGGSGSRTPAGGVWELGSFPIVPWREKELDVRFSIGGEERRLRYPNPAYKPDLAAWQPQPLPLTWEGDGFSATLHSLNLVWNERTTYKGLRWELRQKWSITWNGQPADEWFSVGGSVEDAGGNRSTYGGILGEPAWKLRCSISRTYAFPFAKEDVRWFGVTDAKRFKAIQPGECDMLTIDPESRSFGVLFAGLFAPGEYEVEDGKVLAQSPPGVGGPVPFLKASADAETGRVKMSVDRTTFIRHVRRELQPGWWEVWQTEDGKAVYLGGQGSEVGGATLWRQELWAARGKSFKYGIARRGESHRFEFLVRPPVVPSGGRPKGDGTNKE